MKKYKYIKFILFILIFLKPVNAFAYLDPGTGSIILQAIIALIGGVIAFFALIKNKIIEFYKKIKKRINGI
jgi:hypothetical protein